MQINVLAYLRYLNCALVNIHRDCCKQFSSISIRKSDDFFGQRCLKLDFGSGYRYLEELKFKPMAGKCLTIGFCNLKRLCFGQFLFYFIFFQSLQSFFLKNLEIFDAFVEIKVKEWVEKAQGNDCCNFCQVFLIKSRIFWVKNFLS